MRFCKVLDTFFIILLINSAYCDSENKYSDSKKPSDACNGKENDQNDYCSKLEAKKLTRLDGVEVGFSREVKVEGDKILHLSTLNMKPLLFEIKDFLTKKECSHIISLATKVGIKSSVTHQETNVDGIRIMDNNGDKMLDITEMKITIEDNYDIYLDDADIRTLYADLEIDPNKDDIVTKDEMLKLSPKDLRAYLNNLVTTSPIKKSRFSEQAWIFPNEHKDKLLDTITDRLKNILELPPVLIDKYNAIQVVHYGRHGHYNAHQDSGSTDQPCCHLHSNKKCSICRYLTFMLYLNDVEEGGETAFPIANNETFNIHTFRQSGNTHLNSRCNQANLRVKPELGKAVIWYNHLVDEETGWLGDLDDYTWHGGCPVTKGTKWIMNRWINVSPDREIDLRI
ncbi:transmembrane prolyl 4-hydroxylase-like [Antedon mediterranea]|uniref:transmembrane prolyl 4-hydroxylase-like n=1 Tax=Antedon mediterranea TaxID=105859 RepID=UPI003AF5609D